MTKQILRLVVAGIIGGVALFIMPFFLVRLLVFFLLIKLMFRVIRGKRSYYGWHRCSPAFAGRYKNMSEEERKAYMDKYGYECRTWHCNEEKTEEETKK